MSFSADWLALRSAPDVRARNAALAVRLAEFLPSHNLRILDLGSGTGANLAALSPSLQQQQHWVLTDNDQDLLDRVHPPDDMSCDRITVDLSEGQSALFTPPPDLVTASAFFDLCGPKLVNRIVADTVDAGAAFYTVLTYDGREVWEPPHPLDAEVLPAFHADQRSDKGLGPALGPDATAYLAGQFEAAGYKVFTAPSDWMLEQDRDTDLIRELANGSASAVAPKIGQTKAEDWRDARQNAATVMIGHQDLLALPG